MGFALCAMVFVAIGTSFLLPFASYMLYILYSLVDCFAKDVYVQTRGLVHKFTKSLLEVI